ncbi:ABC-2 type transport system permease protein [Variovorax sp. HW608]|uniref:ABC transporter permease n=1 Tax=Variovorax sp. HW608 TaxID=1034889 RepID=UPI00081FEC5E|nr:ABC transporter permease [Variovorax sp. HW608]SCK20723.1 ABC-2 type transport system permease protein [Variovorax sp. HW608]
MIRLVAAIRKEFRQFLRDRVLLALIVFIYTADVVMCTAALSFDVRNLKLVVYDSDRTELSARLVDRFRATDYFRLLLPAASLPAIDGMLDAGRADLALVIPAGFAADVGSGRSPQVQVILSGTNSNTANAARGYAQAIVGGFAHEVMVQQAARQGLTGTLPGVRAETRIWYNPQLEFKHFMAVSMIVVASALVGIVTAAAGLVREKESGTIEQLIVTPLRSHELIVAKAAPPLVIGMVALVPSLMIGRWFGVPMPGDLTLFFAASAIGLTAFLSIGFLIGTLAQNLQQALLLSFLVLFPLMFLSGTTVPVESMPTFMQWLASLSPVRHYMEIGLGVLMKGVGIRVLWTHFAMLAGTTAMLGTWSVMRLRRQLYA